MVKLIALDLDRTTLTSDGHLSEANKRALSGAIKRGVHVLPAAGHLILFQRKCLMYRE